MPRIRTTSKTIEAAPEYEVVYKYEVTGFNRGDMNNAKPITDTVVLHFNGAPDRKEANQKAIAEFEKKHSDCYGDTTRLLDIQNIKKGGRSEGRKKAEGHEGWDGWEEVEGLEDSIEGIESLAYELRHCIRGANTRCKDWKALALYIKGLASNLDDAAELMAYKTDGDESVNESPVSELLDALKQALAGKGYKVSQFTSDKEFVGQRKAFDGVSIENEDPTAYHKNPYRIVLDTDANLFRIFFPHVRRKSVTGQLGSISGIVKFILSDLNLDVSEKNPRK